MKPILVIIFFALSWTASGQSQFKIDSVLWEKGQTSFVRARQLQTDSVGYFKVNYQGVGRKENLIGLWGTFHPDGIKKRKRKLFFTINE